MHIFHFFEAIYRLNCWMDPYPTFYLINIPHSAQYSRCDVYTLTVQQSFSGSNNQRSATTETYFGPVICACLWLKVARYSSFCRNQFEQVPLKVELETKENTTWASDAEVCSGLPAK